MTSRRHNLGPTSREEGDERRAQFLKKAQLHHNKLLIAKASLKEQRVAEEIREAEAAAALRIERFEKEHAKLVKSYAARIKAAESSAAKKIAAIKAETKTRVEGWRLLTTVAETSTSKRIEERRAALEARKQTILAGIEEAETPTKIKWSLIMSYLRSLPKEERRGIFEIVHSVERKQLVISSTDIAITLQVHVSTLRNGKHYNDQLQRDWLSSDMGAEDAFDFGVVEQIHRIQLEVDPTYMVYARQQAIEKGGGYYNAGSDDKEYW